MKNIIRTPETHPLTWRLRDDKQPVWLDEYRSKNGYEGARKALTGLSPDEIVNQVKDSGLKGRGGAGFSTGLKWSLMPKDESMNIRYLLCNADEMEPGTYKDRLLMEQLPHLLVEGMLISAFALKAYRGYIFLRGEYIEAAVNLRRAIAEATEAGLLGKNIFDTGFDFDIELRLGAGAFVCGEETSLMTSIEGHRGEPRPRPPYPAVKGLFGKPTILNNVETYANIAQIILKGADWFKPIGTERSHGTKVFALGGKINNTGLVEVPMGITLREVIEDIGGGVSNGGKFKAAQTGGPSGGCIPASQMDVKIDYDNLIAIGSMMGSGGLIVMDESTCMVDIAEFFLRFTVDESCGKCTACRIGTRRLLEILEKITSGRGEHGDIERL